MLILQSCLTYLSESISIFFTRIALCRKPNIEKVACLKRKYYRTERNEQLQIDCEQDSESSTLRNSIQLYAFEKTLKR